MRIHLPLIVTSTVAIAAVALVMVDIKLPVVEIDPASALRGSLGVPLEDLGLGQNTGDVSFLLNGGLALLSGAVACLAVARRRGRKTSSAHEQAGKWPSGDSVPTM